MTAVAALDDLDAPLPARGLGLGVWARTPLPGPWKALRACRDAPPDLFQPARGDLDGVARAKALCSRCPVEAECLAYAMRYPSIIGIFGGTSDSERRVMRRPTAKSA